MKKPKQSKHCSLGAGGISQIPDNVIDKILTSLPIVEAAKTAVLSKNWNRGWRNISVLKFDGCFGKKFEKAGRPNLMLAIYQILFLHSGVIDGFTLSIPWLESCAEINPLIQFLSEKKVKHLNIRFEYGEFHALPSYLFSCFQLRTLNLAGCVINPLHSFGGFSQLMTFVLDEVHVTNDFFGRCISKCPLLNQLSFYAYDDKYMGGKPLNFDTLKKLQLDEFCSAVPTLGKLNVDQSFLQILEVRNLSGEPSHPPHCLQKLKVLNVYLICFANLEDVSSLIGLIRSSPNLERFSAKMHECDKVSLVPISPLKILEPDQYDLSCNSLQTVELFGFDGTDPEMEFVKSLLSKSPQLKTMTIRQASKDDQKGMQILQKMIRFQRASAVVDINFCGPDAAPV